MPISHTAKVATKEPSEEIDLGTWIFGLSDRDYRACAKGHHGAGTYTDENGRGMVNVESVGGHLIVQHYRRSTHTPPRSRCTRPRAGCTCFTWSRWPPRCDGGWEWNHGPRRRRT